MRCYYDAWYETVKDQSIEKHYVANNVDYWRAHEIKRAHKYREFIRVTRAAQPGNAGDGSDAQPHSDTQARA